MSRQRMQANTTGLVAMADQEGQYVLRCSLIGHGDDVRGVVVCPGSDDASAGELATSSRDKTIKVWRPLDESGGYEERLTLVGHTDFVVPLISIPRGITELYPSGAIISGSRDTTVRTWDFEDGTSLETFTGHEYQVTGLAASLSGVIVSCSLDKTLRVWRGGSCVSVMQGHDGPVLCVATLPSDDIVSGGGDGVIKKWILSRTGCVCEATWTGHTDSVRSLVVVPDFGVASGSHDMTVRLWNFQGAPLGTLTGHTAIIYSVAAFSAGCIASGSEDNTVRLWHCGNAACLQVIDHPGCVWSLAFLPNADVLTGCSDGVARIFSADKSRQASSEEIKGFHEEIESRKAAAGGGGNDGGGGGGGGGGGTNLPPGVTLEDPIVLQTPGRKDGDLKLVQEGGVGVAYTWSVSNGIWERLGEITDRPDDNVGTGAKFYEGKQYDFVFDVDIGDGIPHRKLPVNAGDNPVVVAQKWLEEQNLPITYQEQVVNFIVQNTGGAAAVPIDPSVNVDPFTGGGAYRPGGSQTSMASIKQKPAYRHVPKVGFVYYDTLPFDAVTKKIQELSSAMSNALTSGDVALLQGIVTKLKDTAQYHTSQFSSSEYDLVARLLEWPEESVFPCVDIARMMILHPQGAGHFAGENGSGLLEAIIEKASRPSAPASLQMVVMRLLTNCFRHAEMSKWITEHCSPLISKFSGLAQSQNKHVRLGLANFLLNSSVAFQSMMAAERLVLVLQCASSASELLNACPAEDAETIFRSLVCLGTLAYNDKEANVLSTLELNTGLSKASKLGGKVQEAVIDVQSCLL